MSMERNGMKLADKVAIITGSSRGLGKFMAEGLAREGCNIVVAARSEEESDPKLSGTIFSTAEELRGLGVRALPVRTDVTDEASIRALVQAALDEFGRIDILINNAGIMFPGKLWETPIKRWDLITQVNVRGAVIACQAVIPHMIERKDGVIVNVSSIVADQQASGNISYSLTKQALRKLSQGLAGEVEEHNVRVFSLSPEGLVLTPGTMYHRLQDQVPEGPYVEAPEAMGLAVLYLCGDDGRQHIGKHFYSRALLRDAGLWDEPAPPGAP